MYSSKSVGPQMVPWGTPALTGYSCEHLPSRTTWSHLLLRKEEIRTNIWPEIPYDLSLWRRPRCQTLSKALDILSATVWVALDLLKALAILSDKAVRGSAVDCMKISKKATFLWVINNTIIYKFFKDFTNHRKKTNRAVVF